MEVMRTPLKTGGGLREVSRDYKTPLKSPLVQGGTLCFWKWAQKSSSEKELFTTYINLRCRHGQLPAWTSRQDKIVACRLITHRLPRLSLAAWKRFRLEWS